MNAYDQLIKRCTCHRQDFEGVEICHIKNFFDRCFVVTARDRFLSGCGVAEGKTAYQVIVCYSARQADVIRLTLKNMKDFSHVESYNLTDFLNSKMLTGKYQVTNLKNGNRVPAWNNGEIVEVK